MKTSKHTNDPLDYVPYLICNCTLFINYILTIQPEVGWKMAM